MSDNEELAQEVQAWDTGKIDPKECHHSGGVERVLRAGAPPHHSQGRTSGRPDGQDVDARDRPFAPPQRHRGISDSSWRLRAGHEEFRKKLLADPEVREAYEAQADEFALFEQLFQARKRAGLTLEQVAEKMGTKPSAVSRLGTPKHSPSISTLKKYAEAVGHRLEVKLVPEKSLGTGSSAPKSKKRAM